MTLPTIRRQLELNYEQAVQRIPELLKAEGFGVLTEVDIQHTLKEKLDVDFRRYKVFGACNPPLAHRALLSDLDVGVMLPCNVAIYEDDRGKAVVAAIDPVATMGAVGNDDLQILAADAKARLERVVTALTAQKKG